MLLVCGVVFVLCTLWEYIIFGLYVCGILLNIELCWMSSSVSESFVFHVNVDNCYLSNFVFYLGMMVFMKSIICFVTVSVE